MEKVISQCIFFENLRGHQGKSRVHDNRLSWLVFLGFCLFSWHTSNMKSKLFCSNRWWQVVRNSERWLTDPGKTLKPGNFIPRWGLQWMILWADSCWENKTKQNQKTTWHRSPLSDFHPTAACKWTVPKSRFGLQRDGDFHHQFIRWHVI